MMQSSAFTRLLTGSVNLVPWWLRDHVRKLPGISRLQRAIVRSALEGTEFVHLINAGPAAGLRIHIRMPDDKLYWTGTWEQHVTSRIVSLIKPGAVCYDIGGHRGFMAGIMARNGARVVYCFEPNPANAKKIEELTAFNRDLRIILLPCAVAAEDGAARFSLMPESTMGKLSASAFQSEVECSGKIDVEVRALDSLLLTDEIEPPAFIKIDIEGSESAALKGAATLVERHRPSFLIEVHSFELLEDCHVWLAERDYELTMVESWPTATCEKDFRVCHIVAVPR